VDFRCPICDCKTNLRTSYSYRYESTVHEATTSSAIAMLTRLLVVFEWILFYQTSNAFIHRHFPSSILFQGYNDCVGKPRSLLKNPRILCSKSLKCDGMQNSLLSRYFPLKFFSELSPGLFSDDPSMDETTDVSELRLRAKALREEARSLEIALEDSKLKKYTKTSTDVQQWMNRLFVCGTNHTDGPTASSVAQILLQERFSEDQLILLMESLYRRRNAASIRRNHDDIPGNPFVVNDAVDTLSGNQTDADLMGDYMKILLEAAALLDQKCSNDSRRWSGRFSSQLQSRLNEWSRTDEVNVRRHLDTEFLRSRMNKNVSISNFFRKSMEGLSTPTTDSTVKDDSSENAAVISERVRPIPTWIPPSLLTTVLTSEAKIDPSDVLAIRERVLTKTRFFCTSSDSTVNTAIFRGNMRPGTSNGPLNSKEMRLFSSVVFNEIEKALEREGLSERIQLFFLHDPDWRPSDDLREMRPKPVVIALPKQVTPFETTIQPNRSSKLFKKFAPLLALVTSCVFSARCYALNPTIFDGIVNRRDVSVLSRCIPLTTIPLIIQGIHELTHHIVATKRGIRVGVPLLVPSSELGNFGCITAIKSFPLDRSSMFDFALSGPLASTILSVLFMILGCYKTLHSPPEAILNYPTVPLATLKSSFLCGSILSIMLPKVMMMPLSQPIPIHPLFIGGFSGLAISSLNSLPIFRLDGGRACTAVVGSRVGALTSSWTLLSLLSLGISGSNLAWSWVAFVLLFQRRPEVTSRNDVTPVGTTRIVIWVLSLSVSLLALLPFPGGSIL
jgi:Zn-dependent protease